MNLFRVSHVMLHGRYTLSLHFCSSNCKYWLIQPVNRFLDLSQVSDSHINALQKAFFPAAKQGLPAVKCYTVSKTLYTGAAQCRQRICWIRVLAYESSLYQRLSFYNARTSTKHYMIDSNLPLDMNDSRKYKMMKSRKAK